MVDVAGIEILVGYRLTSSTIDKVSLKVPRLHKDHFQDDIFCNTFDTENAHLSAQEWIQGKIPTFKVIDLKPSGMPLCKKKSLTVVSQRVSAPVEKKTIIFQKERTEQEKKDDAMKNMIEQASKLDTKLEQDAMEGCAEDEWD